MQILLSLFMFLDAILCLENTEYECRQSYSGVDEDSNIEHMETDPTRFYSKTNPRSHMPYGVPDRLFVTFPDTPSILDLEIERMHDDCQTQPSPYLYQSSDRMTSRKPKHCPQPIPFCQPQQESPAFCLPPPSVPPCSHLQDTLMNVNTYFNSVLQKADHEYIKLVEAFTRDFAQVILEAKKNLSIKITLDKDDLVKLITSALTNTSSEDLDLVVSAVNKENAALDTQVNSLKAIAEEKIIKILNALAEQTDAAIIASATNLSTFSGLLLQHLDVFNTLGNELGQVLSQSTDNLTLALDEIFGCENAQGFRQISDALSNNNTAQLNLLVSKSKNVNQKINEVILQFVKDVSALYYRLFTNLGQYNVKAVRDLCKRLELSSINPTLSQNASGSGLCSQSTFSPFGSVTR